MENKNRIWPEGEGLTWSTITGLLEDGDLTSHNLKNCTLDLTDALAKKKEKVAELEKKLAEAKSGVSFLESNIDACIDFAIKRIDTQIKKLVFLHDAEEKFIVVTRQDEKIIVNEISITL